MREFRFHILVFPHHDIGTEILLPSGIVDMNGKLNARSVRK